jgi:HEAT repeat protein
LLHELAHVRRCDDWLAPPLEAVRVLFFFHPLVRWLLRRLECERELLCDEMAIRRGVDPREYAGMLLEFARNSGRFADPSALLALGAKRTIKVRINHLLEENMERWIAPLPARRAVALAIVLLALGLSVASYRALALEAEKSDTPAEEEKKPARAADEKKKTLPDKPPAKRVKREALRYGGKNFDQWRTELETELKSEIRIDGLTALAAFGANGYGTEATRTILDMMKNYNQNQLVNRAGSPSKDQAVVDAAYEAILKIDDAAVPLLVESLGDDNRNVRAFAMNCLLSHGIHDTETPLFLKAASSKKVTVRLAALNLLSGIQSIPKGYIPLLIERSNDENAEVRAAAINNLTSAANLQGARAHAKAVVPVLIKAMKNPQEDIQQGAIVALGEYGPEAKSAVPALIEKLKTEKQLLAVLNTLAAIGPEAKAALPTLNELRGKKIADLPTAQDRALVGKGPSGQQETYRDRIDATIKKIEGK